MNITKQCNRVQDIVCECINGYFWQSDSHDSEEGFCKKHSVCNEEELIPGNKFNDTVCGSCEHGSSFNAATKKCLKSGLSDAEIAGIIVAVIMTTIGAICAIVKMCCLKDRNSKCAMWRNSAHLKQSDCTCCLSHNPRNNMNRGIEEQEVKVQTEKSRCSDPLLIDNDSSCTTGKSISNGTSGSVPIDTNSNEDKNPESKFRTINNASPTSKRVSCLQPTEKISSENKQSADSDSMWLRILDAIARALPTTDFDRFFRFLADNSKSFSFGEADTLIANECGKDCYQKHYNLMKHWRQKLPQATPEDIIRVLETCGLNLCADRLKDVLHNIKITDRNV